MDQITNPWIVTVVSIVVLVAIEFRDWYLAHWRH